MSYPYNAIPTNNPQNLTLASPVGLIIPSPPRNPTASDNTYVPGTEWQNTQTGHFFKCISSGFSGAVWTAFVPAGSGNLSTLTANSGGVVSPDAMGNINVVGDGTTITIAGNPGTNTLTASLVGSSPAIETFATNVAGPVGPTGGGSINVNASTSTYTDGSVANTLKTEVQGLNHRLLIGRGVSTPITTLPAATNGQVLIGSTGVDPVWAALTAGANITITPGAGSISIAASTGTLTTLTGNSGGAVSPTGGNINVVGDGITISIAGNPGTSTLTASFIGGMAATSYITNIAGPVVPTGAGAVNVNASTSTYTDGTVANTIKIEVQGTNHGLFVGRGTDVPATTLGVGTTGQVLVASTGADPAFGIAPVNGGGTGNTTFTPYSVICAGTTATGAFQNVSGVGTVGQVLVSNGAGTLPSWSSSPSSAFTSVNYQVFTTTGTYTPTSGMLYCIIEMVGGGGGGGNATNGGNSYCAGAGGSGGEYAAGIFSAGSIGVNKAVTIGAGGTATNGGGTTSVGVLITAIGGGGGVSGVPQTGASNSQLPVAGGTGGIGGSIRFPGGASGGGWVTPTGAMAAAGDGGTSRFSQGVKGITLLNNSLVQTNNGTAGTGFGGGGSGAFSYGVGSGSATGGSGSAGYVVITEFI